MQKMDLNISRVEFLLCLETDSHVYALSFLNEGLFGKWQRGLKIQVTWVIM